MLFLHFSFECESRTIKCNADERCRRQLDGDEPLSAPTGADANASRHSGHEETISKEVVSFRCTPPCACVSRMI